jgi:hypothetical protein
VLGRERHQLLVAVPGQRADGLDRRAKRQASPNVRPDTPPPLTDESWLPNYSRSGSPRSGSPGSPGPRLRTSRSGGDSPARTRGHPACSR